jgi:hypothetical protein
MLYWEVKGSLALLDFVVAFAFAYPKWNPQWNPKWKASDSV